MALHALHNPTATFAIAVLVAVSTSGPSTAAPDPSRQCDQAAAQAAQRHGVPIDILLAIARVESGRGGSEPRPWPWTINADGQGTWYDTKAEAVAAATAHLTDGTGTFDVGCFQLNIRWHGENFADLADMFDPTENADHAAAFLIDLYQESGDWEQAVAAYHSRTEALASAYLERVRSVLDGPASNPDTTDYDAEPVIRENQFPLLQAGGQGSAGSLVPQQMARGPLIGGSS